jgi:hypothetical protein
VPQPLPLRAVGQCLNHAASCNSRDGALCAVALALPRAAEASDVTAPIEQLDVALLQAMKAGDDTHVLGYATRQGPGGWKAVDVTADSSISEVAAQQDQIRSLFRSGGGAGLLARLQQKTSELSGGASR